MLARLLFAFCLLVLPTGAGASSVENPHSTAELTAETMGFEPGGSVRLGLTLTPQEGWHSYWLNPGDSGLRTRLNWTVPDGVTVSDISWPVPERLPVGPLMNYGYDQAETFMVTLHIAPSYAGDTVPIELVAEWLICEIECIPETGRFSLTLSRANEVTSTDPRFAAADRRLARAMPFPLEAVANERAFQLSVTMTAEEAGLIGDAYFFPATEGILAYNRDQIVAVGDNGLQVAAMRPGYGELPDRATGVLVLETGAGIEAFAVDTPIRVLAAASDPLVSSAATGADDLSLPLALVFAFLGGLILNLMPCVFPVLSMKALAFVASGHGDAAANRRDGLAYTAGILLSFAGVAGTLLTLRSGGMAIGWGFQLQEPLVIAALAIILLLVALMLFGQLHLGGDFQAAGDTLTRSGGARGAFFTGFLATIVATPCTVPFMAPAMGFALTQSDNLAFLIFMALGLGLAAPFLILSFVPAFADRLPKPGPWMESFRQFLGFPMLATVVWLLWVFDQQMGATATAVLLLTLVAVGFAIWSFDRAGAGVLSKVGKGLSIILLFAALYALVGVKGEATTAVPPAETVASLSVEPWSPDLVAQYVAAEEPVFVFFTAAWCITCKVNERLVLEDSAVVRAAGAGAVHILKADWTNRNAGIAAELERFGHLGVPLYLFYPKGKSVPIILPQILTSGLMKDLFAGRRISL